MNEEKRYKIQFIDSEEDVTRTVRLSLRSLRGLAVGAGFYLGAGVTTGVVFLILWNLSRLDMWVDHDRILALSIYTLDRPGQIMRISACIEDLHLRARGVKVKTDEDEAETGGERRVYLNFEVYNSESLRRAFIIDALRQVDGVLRVDVV